MAVIFSLISINLLLWNIFIPIFELPSEQLYFHRVQEIFTQKQLADLRQAQLGDLIYPDTYPLLLVPVLMIFHPPSIFYPGTRVFDAQLITHLPSQRGRFNRFLHPLAERNFNWNRLAWSIHAMRFLTSLIFLASLWLLYRTAQKIFLRPSHLPEALMLFSGFAPKMAHRATSIVNLPLLFLSFSLFYYFVFSRKPGLKTAFLLGLSTGLGIIVKITGYNLVLFFLVYLFLFVKSNARKLSQLISFSLGCTLVSGWYFIRNWLLYGNPLAAIFLQPPAPTDAASSLGNQFNYWYTVVFDTFQTFWDGFGWEVISLGRWFNFLILIITITALLGFVSYLPRLTHKLKFLVATLFIYIVTFLIINLKFFTPQGKDFMPLLLPIAVIYILGLQSWRLVNHKIYLASITLISTYFFSKSAILNFLKTSQFYYLGLVIADGLLIFFVVKLCLRLARPKLNLSPFTWAFLAFIINLIILFLVVSPKTFGDQNISSSEYYLQRALEQQTLGQTLVQLIDFHF